MNVITISTRDYSIEQLKHLSAALYAVERKIIDSGNVTRKIGVRWAVKYTRFARIYTAQEYI